MCQGVGEKNLHQQPQKKIFFVAVGAIFFTTPLCVGCNCQLLLACQRPVNLAPDCRRVSKSFFPAGRLSNFDEKRFTDKERRNDRWNHSQDECPDRCITARSRPAARAVMQVDQDHSLRQARRDDDTSTVLAGDQMRTLDFVNSQLAPL